MNFGARLKKVRKSRGVSQGALAHHIGSTQAAISALEVRDSRTSENLFEIASALEVNPYWLQTGMGSPERAPEWLVGSLLQGYFDADAIEALRALAPHLNEVSSNALTDILSLMDAGFHAPDTNLSVRCA